MMFYISLAAFAGVVVFGLLFIIMGLQGGPWKLPGIGMAVCFVLLVVSAVLPRLGVGGEKPGTADQPSQAVESQAVESEAVDKDTSAPETDGQKEADTPPTIAPTKEPEKTQSEAPSAEPTPSDTVTMG